MGMVRGCVVGHRTYRWGSPTRSRICHVWVAVNRDRSRICPAAVAYRALGAPISSPSGTGPAETVSPRRGLILGESAHLPAHAIRHSAHRDEWWDARGVLRCPTHLSGTPPGQVSRCGLGLGCSRGERLPTRGRVSLCEAFHGSAAVDSVPTELIGEPTRTSRPRACAVGHSEAG